MLDAMLTLKRAIPYIRLYKGKTFVVKLGGRVLQQRDVLDALTEDITLLHQVGIRVVVVHGGGPQLDALSRRLGIEPVIVAGRRVTDESTLEMAKMVYAGSLNIDILSSLRAHQTPAVGVSGVDGNFITARRRGAKSVRPVPGAAALEIDFGHVGDIEAVNVAFVQHLLQGDLVPVVSSLASDAEGNIFNVNADTVASAIAGAVGADKLLLLTDTDGILRDVSNPASLVSYTDIDELQQLEASGALSGGMLPKVTACVNALRAGVRRTHILNGCKPGALLLEVFTNAGCGTMIVDRREREHYQHEINVSQEPASAERT